jgi:Flp pilus assembly protein TadD
VPEEPSVLSNLGLSYMLQNNLPRAEETLRRANSRNPADSRVRANLALVVGLEGKQAEAETIVKADLPPDQAAEKVTALRQLLAKKQQRADK